MDIDTQPTMGEDSGGGSSSHTNEQRNDSQQMQAMDSSTLMARAATAHSNSPPLLLGGHERSALLFSPVLSPPAGVPAMVVHEDETWMPGRSSLQTQSPPLYSAPPAASPPLLQRPSSNPPFGGSGSCIIGQHHPMQLSSSTSPSLFDVGAAAASVPSSQQPTEAAIVHSFLAFSPSPPTTASQSGAASQADESMGPQQAATLQQSQAHQQQSQTQILHEQQQSTVQLPSSQPQQAIAPSVPAPFLIPLFSPSPTLDGHALSLHPPNSLFDLHADLFSPQPPALQHTQAHHQLPTHSARALTLLDVSSPPPMLPVPRNSPRLAAAPFVAASPASASLASGSPSPRLHHPRPQQHSPLQRYATELEVAEFFHAQNQLSERLASEIEAIQRRRQLRESLPTMELAPTAAAAASSAYHPRTAHIAAHHPSAAAVTQHQPYTQQRPVLAALAPSLERAVRVDAQHFQLSRTSTSLPRNRRVMAPVIHVPQQHHTAVAQEISSPPSSILPFRLSSFSASSVKPHVPALPAQPHVPLATRAAPMSRFPQRSIVSPQRSPVPSLHCTRAAAAAAGSFSSCSHASPVTSTGQGVVMMEDTDESGRYHRPADSGGSNSVASLGSSVAPVPGGRRSMSRALSPLARECLSPPQLPGVAASSAASAASVDGSESSDLLITRKPRAAPTSKRKHCDWPGCVSHFAKLSALIRHRRVHTKEKPFVCESDGCTAAFSEKGNLVRHEEEMHADHRKFACPFSNYCAQRFRRAAHLEQHLVSRHAAFGEDITKPWLFHAPPDEPAQAPIKRKWRAAAAAAAGTKKEVVSTGTSTSTEQAAAEPITQEPLAAASMRPFSFSSSLLPPLWPPAATTAASSAAAFLLPPSALRDVSSSSDRRFVINTAAVQAAAAAAATGSTTTAATMPLQRVRVPPLAAAAPVAPAASLPAGSKRRLAALSPPQPLLSDSSSSSDASLPLLVAMDALHLPSAHDAPADDNVAAQPRSPRPKRSRRAAANTKLTLPLAHMDRRSNGKSS